MISHAEFGKLRLMQFIPESELEELQGWEYMDHLWLGESYGFSEWLRLEAEPGILRCLALDFSDFPQEALLKVIKRLDLSVWGGMKLDPLIQLFGKPIHEEHFVKDRVTYEFSLQETAEYTLSCTVLNEGGLTYLVIQSPIPPEITPLHS
jgi:hypothetical protein